MASTSFLQTLYLFMVATSIYPLTTVALGVSDHHLGWVPMTTTTTTTPPCQDSIEECIANGEFVMDSESHRRILATTSQYINYKVLQADTVPCSIKGASYYNCKPGASANLYTRGCDRITRCRNI